MQAQESWYQSAARTERARLFPKGIVGLFALAMVLVGWLALPSQSLHERLANAQDSDILTVAYLNAWLNAAPNDQRIRLTLARHLALTGKDGQSIGLLNELIADATSGPVLQSARRLKLNILERRYYAMHELDSKRAALLEKIRSELELVANELTSPIELEVMLERATAVEHNELVTSLLQRLAGVDPGLRGRGSSNWSGDLPPANAQSTEAYARQAIALGDFRLAAAIYWRAFDEAQSHPERRRFLSLTAKAEQAGNRVPEFFKALESRLDMVMLDSNGYQELARLALAVGRHDLAQHFAKQMLQFSGWWKGVQVGDAGRIMSVGWRWMVSRAESFSPVGSASAQEVSEEDSHVAVSSRPKLRLALETVPVKVPYESGSTVTETQSETQAKNQAEAQVRTGQAKQSVSASVKLAADKLAPNKEALELATQPEQEQPALGESTLLKEPTAVLTATAIDQPDLMAEIFAEPSSNVTVSGASPPESEALTSATISGSEPATVPPIRMPTVAQSRIKSIRIVEESAVPVASPTASQVSPPGGTQRESANNEPVVLSDPLAQVISQSLAGQAIRGVAETERERVTNAVLPLHLRGRVPGLQQFGPDGSILLGDPANPNVALVPERWVTLRRLEPGLFARQANQAEQSARVQGAQSEDQALANLDENLGELYGQLQGSVPKPKRQFSTKPLKERPHLAFDQAKYLLAYQIFLAGAHVDNAFAVALAAIDQRPKSLEWRVRLAQAAQWSQRPIEALTHWKYLAQRTNKTKYWKNVETLAVGLLDLDSLLEYLRYEIARSPNDVETILRIAQAYEDRGEPARAIDWLRKQVARGKPVDTERVYAELVQLLEQSGRNNDAIDMLVAMSNKFGPNIKRSLRLSSALYKRGDIQLAFQALEFSARLAADLGKHTAADEEEIPFWGNYIELARLSQQYDAALRGYRQLLAREVFTAETILTMSAILEPRSLSAAAETTSLGYFRFRQPELAQRTVSLWFRAGQLDAVNRFLAQMPAVERKLLTRSAKFLRQRANYYQSAGLYSSAVADLIQVHHLEPQNMDVRSALLWALLAKRDPRRLRALLKSWQPLAEKEPKLWGPFAAGLLALGEPNAALPYFVRQAKKRDDYLWWLSYADALDAVGRADSAWTLRRRAWVELRKNAKKELKDSPEKRQRIVGLAMRFAPARQTHALLAQLVKDRKAPPGPSPNKTDFVEPVMTAELAGSATAGTVLASILRKLPQVSNTEEQPVVTPAQSQAMRSAASELAVSYFLSHRNVDSARAWLLSRYAQDLVQPAWANLSIALANHDNDELDHLLNTMPDWLPKLDRISALRRVGRIAESQSLAFDTMSERPDSDAAHQALVDSMMQGGPSAGITSVSAQQGALDYTRHRIDGAVRIDQHAQIYGFAENGRTSSIDSTILNNASSSRSNVGMGLKWTRPDGVITAELSQRKALADNTTLRARWQHMVSPMLDVALDAGINQPTSELPALIVGGQKDHVRAQATVNLTGRDYINGSAKFGRLETQLGTRVSGISQFQLEYGHKWRLDYPDVTFRAQIVRSDYSKTNKNDPITTRLAPFGAPNPSDSFVPASSTQVNLFANVGSAVSEKYSRALRFFGQAGLSWNASSGAGFSLRGGLTTSLFGTDRLTIYGALTRKSPGDIRGSQEFGLAYRLYY